MPASKSQTCCDGPGERRRRGHRLRRCPSPFACRRSQWRGPRRVLACHQQRCPLWLRRPLITRPEGPIPPPPCLHLPSERSPSLNPSPYLVVVVVGCRIEHLSPARSRLMASRPHVSANMCLSSDNRKGPAHRLTSVPHPGLQPGGVSPDGWSKVVNKGGENIYI